MIKYEYVGEAGRCLAEEIETKIPPQDCDAIVFVGALGICVRKLQGLIKDKHTDPAVVCVDTTGRWVIPVLSGHVGGANDLARRIAAAIDAEAVITTQSDNSGLWALDTIAKDYGWNTRLADGLSMNDVIFAFVNHKPTALIIEWEDEGTKQMHSTCPSHVTIFSSYNDYKQAGKAFDVTIYVGYHYYSDIALYYIPKCLHLGVGCQRQIPEAAADKILSEVRELGILVDAIASVGTVELKRDEPMVQRLGRVIGKVDIYTSEMLAEVDVPNASDKVREVTGSPSVAEAAALMSGTRLVVEKQKGCYDGLYYTFAIAEHTASGHIEIVGAGPGDPELISLRGRRLLERADLILYAGSLVPKALTECAKAGATVRSSADLNLEQQFELMREHYVKGHLIVRLHTGDPCIYGAIGEQMALFDQYHMSYHITPGISSFQAAAAELQCQFTIPEECQTIILTRGEGRTSMPEREKLHMLAEHQSTMCIFLSATLVDEVQRELLAGGYPADTPVAVCHKLTWPEQTIYRGQLSNLAQLVHNNKLTLTTMIVVGRAIDNRKGLSRLYSNQFSHLFRSSSI